MVNKFSGQRLFNAKSGAAVQKGYLEKLIKGFFKETAKKRKKKLAAQNKGQLAGKEVLAYKDGRPYFKNK